jgi:hypothetical protein
MEVLTCCRKNQNANSCAFAFCGNDEQFHKRFTCVLILSQESVKLLLFGSMYDGWTINNLELLIVR